MRQKVYELLQTLLSYISSSPSIKNEFQSTLTPPPPRGHLSAPEIIEGILTIAYGEKDPRCLLQCFRILSLVSAAFSAAIFSADPYQSNRSATTTSTQSSAKSLPEQIFDTLSPYFPITFRPPPGDPFKISQSMLVEALGDALSSHSSLSTHAVPFFWSQIMEPTEDVSTLHALAYLRMTIRNHHICRAIYPILPELSSAVFDVLISTPLSTSPGMKREVSEMSLQQRVAREAEELTREICPLLSPSPPSSSSSPSPWSLFAEPLLQHISTTITSHTSSLHYTSLSPMESRRRAIEIAALVGGSSHEGAEAVYAVLLPALIPDYLR